MLTGLIDLQRAALKPWLELGHDVAVKLDGSGVARAALEHILINAAAGEARAADLDACVAADLDGPLRAELIEEQPFLRLFAMRRRDQRPSRRLLLIGPYSGYASRVLSPLIAGLVAGHEVWVTDWNDARLVPHACGAYDLEAQVVTVERLIATAGDPVHVIGLSQSTVPVLAAVARLAARERCRQPRSMTLLGGPLVPGRSGLHDVWFSGWNTFSDLHAFRRVPPPWPGAGREVYPSLHQLALVVLTHPDVYLGLQAQTMIELVLGRGGDHVRWLKDLHSVIDTPAELVRQMIEEVFLTGNLAAGTMLVGGGPVDPSAIDRTPLLTIEAGMDALVGRGDTHRPSGLLGGDGGRHERVTLKGAAHPDLFTGPLAASRVAPQIRVFVEKHDHAG